MDDKAFHVIAQEHLKKEVEVITVQGTFTGRLLFVGKDFIVVETRGRVSQMEMVIRIEFIVAIFRVENFPRSPFGFGPMMGGEGEHESSSEHHEHHEHHEQKEHHETRERR